MEVLDSPQAVIVAARSYASEALEVIAQIMRGSESEKVRLLAAMALLDRATVPRAPKTGEPIETAIDLTTKIAAHLRANNGDSYDEQRLKTELMLRSPATAIRAKLVQMHRDGVIARNGAGSFQAK